MTTISVSFYGKKFTIPFSFDSLVSIQNKIFIYTNVPPNWQYLYFVSKDNSICLTHLIKGLNLGYPDDYKFNKEINIKDVNYLETIPEYVNEIYVLDIRLEFEKLFKSREDLLKYMVNVKLPESIVRFPSLDTLGIFLRSYVRKYWPKISDQEAIVLLHQASRVPVLKDEFKKSLDEINSVYSESKHNLTRMFEYESKMSENISMFNLSPSKISIDQIILAVSTNPDKNLDLFSIFRLFELEEKYPFIKIKKEETTLREKSSLLERDEEEDNKGKKHYNNVINILESLKTRENMKMLKTWIENRPKGLNIKIKTDADTYLDFSLSAPGKILLNCGGYDKVKCLGYIHDLVLKINKISLVKLKDFDSEISTIYLSAVHDVEIDHNSYVNFVLKNGIYKQYFKPSSLQDEIAQKLQFLERKDTKFAKRLQNRQDMLLEKENLTILRYSNKFNNVEPVDVRFITDNGKTTLRIYSEKNLIKGREILLRSLASIVEYIGQEKRQLSIPIEKQSGSNPLLDNLRKKAPEIFTTSSYSINCGKDKQPLIWTKDEFNQLNRATYTYGLEYKGFMYTCRKGQIEGKKEKYPEYPGFQIFQDYKDIVVEERNVKTTIGKNLSEKNVLKLVEKFNLKNPDFKGQIVIQDNELKDKIFWPCCFNKNKSDHNKKMLSEEKIKAPSEYVIATDKILESGRVSNKLIGQLELLFPGFYRYGTDMSTNSILESVLVTVDVPYRRLVIKETKDKYIQTIKDKMASDLTEKLYHLLNEGQLASKYTIKEYKDLLSEGVLEIELIQDYLARLYLINILVFRKQKHHLSCMGQINESLPFIFLIEHGHDHYEALFKPKEQQFLFRIDNPIVKKITQVYNSSCPKVSENKLSELGKKIQLVGQIKNAHEKIIYGITKDGLILPTEPSLPLQDLAFKKLSSVKLTANETFKKLSALDLVEFKPISQIISDTGQTIAIILQNGSIVPTLDSKKILLVPIERDVNFNEDLDFYIKTDKTLENSQTKHKRKEVYSKELIERFRFELSELFKAKPDVKKRMELVLKDRDTIRKLLNELLKNVDIIRSVKKAIDRNKIPQRKVCSVNMNKESCLADPFCNYINNKCQLSMSKSDRKRIVHKVVSELYHLELESQIMKGTVPYHGTTFILRPGEVILEDYKSALEYIEN